MARSFLAVSTPYLYITTGKSPSKPKAKAKEYGIDITDLRGRQFHQSDFDEFDHILCMDESNYRNILRLARSSEDEMKVHMILNFSHPGQNKEVPDPYYGGSDGFELVYQLLDRACDDFLQVVNSEK